MTAFDLPDKPPVQSSRMVWSVWDSQSCKWGSYRWRWRCALRQRMIDPGRRFTHMWKHNV